MASDHPHRPHRLSVPSRAATGPALATPRSRSLHPSYPFPALTPTPTPSKHRLSHSLSSLSAGGGGATPRPLTSAAAASSRTSSLPFLFLLLFSLRSLYSLLPFIRSSPPSFSLFPFSFLVSLLSFLLTLSFSLFPLPRQNRRHQPALSLASIDRSHLTILLPKSALLAVVFLLRFLALRYCSTAALILAQLSGNVAFRFVAGVWTDRDRRGSASKVRGSIFLLMGLLLLSLSWDRRDCFPFSYTDSLDKFGTSVIVGDNCARIWPILLPFLSGFLSSYEKDMMNLAQIRQLGQKRVQLISLLLTTILLFFPAVVGMLVFEEGGGLGVSLNNLGWPLANTVIFAVLLNEWWGDEKYHKDFDKEFLVTFVFTVVLELVYFPELSLGGLLICGFLLWIAVRHLNDAYSNYEELGLDSPEPVFSLIMKPIRHVLSERKSRKIALFLMINAGYMVVEFIAGFMSNSLGLISDACHMLFDCAALAVGLYASYISRFPANCYYNFGRGRFEVLSGYANAVFLVLVGALIVLESFERILDPQEISTNSLLVVSIGGLLVNVVGLIFFHEEHHHAHGGGHGTCAHSHSHAHNHHQHSDHQVEHSHSADAQKTDTSSGCSQSDSHHTHGHNHHDHKNDHSPHRHLHHHASQNHECDHYHHPSELDRVAHAHGSAGCKENHDSTFNHHSSHDHHCSGQKSLPNSTQHNGKSLHHHQHFHIDHNMEGIFLHVLADTMGSVGVVISTLLIKYKGWLIADPVCSIFISVLIVSSVIPLLRNSAEILLQRVPRAHEADLIEALDDVMKIKGVCAIQNLHVWSLTNTDVVGTLHLHISTETDRNSTKTIVLNILKNAGIKDLTLQMECVEK